MEISSAKPSQVAREVVLVLQEAPAAKAKRALLANLADNLGPGGQAATGLNQTLGALFEGQGAHPVRAAGLHRRRADAAPPAAACATWPDSAPSATNP